MPSNTCLLITVPVAQQFHYTNIHIIVQQFMLSVTDFVKCFTIVQKHNKHMATTTHIIDMTATR